MSENVIVKQLWKDATEGKTSVTLAPGTEQETRFTLKGIAFNVKDVVSLAENADNRAERIVLRARATHVNGRDGTDTNGNAKKIGGVKFAASGGKLGAELANAIRAAAGIGKPSNGKPSNGKPSNGKPSKAGIGKPSNGKPSKAEDRANGTTPAPSGNGAADGAK